MKDWYPEEREQFWAIIGGVLTALAFIALRMIFGGG